MNFAVCGRVACSFSSSMMHMLAIFSIIMRRDRVGSFHFERNGLGIAIFTAQTVRIQCTRILSLCHLAFPQLIQLAKTCSTVLTNQPMHPTFQGINIEQTAVVGVGEKPMESEMTEHNLAKLTAHVSTLKNPKAYFRKMAESKLKFSALGVLLNHLLNQPRQLKLYLEDLDFFTDTLFQSVSCGEAEVGFLQIVKEDLHPSLIKGKGHSKEGYSVLSAYQGYLSSTASKRILRYILLNPTYRKETLYQRYDLIEWMRHHLRDQQYLRHFHSLHLLEGVLKKFCRMSAQQEDWKKLLRTLQAMTDMANILHMPDPPPLIRNYIDDPHWAELTQLLSIFKETFQFGPLRVRGGIDLTLDQLKQTYDSMPHLLTLIAKQQQWELDFRIVFLAQVGYLIELAPETILPPAFDDWQLQFSNGANKYYSNQLTEALDREYGDTYGEIQDIEKKITFDMEALVIQRQELILRLYWQLCEIQCFWGVSQVSQSMARPKLSSEALILAHAWHPLLSGEVIRNHSFSFPQAQAPKQRVFNSERNLVNMGYSNRCAIITGPNASGKTVYMKQLGVAIYLAHVGFFVPATLAELPLVDSILFVGKAASIYNQQSCGFHSELASLSSLTQPYVISNKSLVLIDELGSEVDYQNSLKLMYATVEYLTGSKSHFTRNRILSKQEDEFSAPIVIVVTHLSEILSNKIIQENYHVRFLTMMVEDQGISLFKIKPGLVSKGYGLKAAQRILPVEFVALSRRYLEMLAE